MRLRCLLALAITSTAEEIAPELLKDPEPAPAADHSIEAHLKAAAPEPPAAESPARALERLVARGRFGEAATLAKAGGAGLAAAPRPAGAVGGAVVVTPAFRWAQNASHLFAEVRFAHSLTAPANTDARTSSRRPSRRGPAPWTPRRSTPAASAGPCASRSSGTSSTRRRHRGRGVPGRAVIYLGKRHVGVKWPRLVACGVKAPAHSAMWMDMQQALGLDYFPGETADDACEGVEPAARATTTTTEAEADAAFEDFLDDALADDAPAAPATTAAPKKKKKASPGAGARAPQGPQEERDEGAQGRRRGRRQAPQGRRGGPARREPQAPRGPRRAAMFVDHAPAWVPACRGACSCATASGRLNVACARRDEAHKAALHAKLTKFGAASALAAAAVAGAALLSGAGADVALLAVVVAAVFVAAVAVLLRALHAAA
ncbi:hypothetical protein JL722_2619 [Aureococcus anophagefferens]|nr:hypothetical protein JL722_2619 [Aureococcus anophagefferens]